MLASSRLMLMGVSLFLFFSEFGLFFWLKHRVSHMPVKGAFSSEIKQILQRLSPEQMAIFGFIYCALLFLGKFFLGFLIFLVLMQLLSFGFDLFVIRSVFRQK